MIINSINTRDISFVVQGAVDKVHTKLCLESIRRNFPGSTIILSTWEGTNVSGLAYDRVVFNEDPGSAVYDMGGTCNNINRQIISSYQGLKVVSTKYSAKVRSDLIFDDASFLHFFGKFEKYNEQYQFVKSRMIALTIYTRTIHSNVIQPITANYNISDWFLFGYTEDVLNYFRTKKIEDVPYFSRYYLENRDEARNIPYSQFLHQLTPEQYLGSCFFGRNDGSENIVSVSTHNFHEYIMLLVNNFVIVDYNYSRIYSGKWIERSKDEWSIPKPDCISLVFFGDFLRYYKRYCDPHYNIPDEIDKICLKRKLRMVKDILWRDKLREYRNRVIFKLKQLFSPVKSLLRWILPAYRVGYGTRDILLHMQEEQRSNLGYLHYKIDKLSQEVHKKSKEIEELNKHMAALMTQDNDKSS